MKRRGTRTWLSWAALAALSLAVAVCVETPPRPVETSSPPAEPFAELSRGLSEPGGYFDTDNLISNETSYLHAVSDLDSLNLSGGAYIGVGPGQNFSYIAALRPELAFIVDIRRDNALHHLLYKAVFEISPDRVAYLANLIGAATPNEETGSGTGALSDPAPDPGAPDVDALIRRVDALRPLEEQALDELRDRIEAAVLATGMQLTEEDLGTIRRFHDEFVSAGLDLRFSSHYRQPQPYYPTLRRLILERDRSGRQRSYLATEEAYRYLRRFQAEDRLIPVVGNLAGPTALEAIGDHLRARGLEVAAFYTSNVEFYLFQDGSFGRFAENVRSLPLAENGVFIRSYFNRFRRGHPATLPGYASTQLVQPYATFNEAVDEGVSYTALMFR